MCFPNENKRSPTGLRQSSSGIWDQIKGCCGGWKKKWNGFWGEMYQVIKLLLYIYLNSICSRGVCEDFTSVKDKYASGNFSLREDSLIHFSETRAHSNFLENEKLFQQQVKRNLGSFTLMMCCQPVVTERYVPLNRNSEIHERIAFQWVQTGAETFTRAGAFYTNKCRSLRTDHDAQPTQ